MSWMDSWSRPSKSQATPAPFYLIPGAEDTPYCRTCGRVISSRKTTETATKKGARPTQARYCSGRCRSHKPGPLDRRIEDAFVRFLDGEESLPDVGHPKTEKKGVGKKSKGDARILVPCDVVERYVFPHDHDQGEQHDTHSEGSEIGSAEGILDTTDPSSVPSGSVRSTEDADDHFPDPDPAPRQVDGHRAAALSVRSGTRVRPPQDVSEVNGSVGGEKGRAERKHETPQALQRRLEGQRRTKEKEMVRSAARRGVVFGFVVGDGEGEGERRRCEAVMKGSVVEPSFAKGEWAVRWRE